MRDKRGTRREEGRMMEKLQGLMEEAKTRTIIYAILIILLSFCLSLTSNSVSFNIPISILIIAVLRYFSLEIEFQWRMTPIHQESYLSHLNIQSKSCIDPLLLSPPISKKWKRRIDSRVVAAAVDEFVVKIVREFITGLWYSSLTPDQEFPDQIRLLINDVLGEVAQRLKHINLIELLTRDVVDLIGSHIELYRRNQTYIGVDVMDTLSSDERDERLKHYLASTKELHPALISSDNECKVLQQLMGGVVAIVLRSQDVQCPIVRSLARELLACAVMQPIMNFASPMFINEIIEIFVLSAKDEVPIRKTDKGESEKISKGKRTREQPQENYSKYMSDSGIDSMNPRNEVYLRNKYAAETDDWPQRALSPSCNKLPNNWMEFVCDARLRLGDFPELVEAKRQRRTQILAPENLDNVWTKGWNYKLKESRKSLYGSGSLVKSLIPQQDSDGRVKRDKVGEANNSIYGGNIGMPTIMDTFDTEGNAKWTERGKQGSVCGIVQCSDQTQDRDLPITSRSPLDNTYEKQDESITHAIQRLKVQHRHSKSGGTESEQWQKFDRTYISEDKGNSLTKNRQGSSGSEMYGIFHNDNQSAAVRSQTGNIFVRKLDCWVLGVHFEKVGMKSIAVYSIAVTNSENKTWFVDRRYRNFEQLHRRLRNIPNYKLHIPPKSFISSNLDDFFIRQRCILLDKYLKDLLSIPNIAEQHEVWDFLSATSKNYSFGKIPSVMETLAYNVDDAMVDLVRQFKGVSSGLRHTIVGTSSARKESYINVPWRSERGDMKNTNWDRMNKSCYLVDEEEHAGESGHSTQFLIQTGGWLSDSELHEEHFSSQLNVNTGGNPATSILERSQKSEKGSERPGLDDYSTTESLSGSEMLEDEVRDPPEWTPPKLCVPLLDLIDKVFQLHQNGWLRRQVFWIGKQILQLLMEDAIDDWLLRQIQWLKREDVIAFGIKQVQDVLVVEGIFTSEDDIQQQNESRRSCNLGDKDADGKTIQTTTNPRAYFQNQLEAAKRASLVCDIIFGGAPAPLVSIIGSKQYDRCAKDLYFFLQSTVCVKQLAYSLLELLLITIFPELHDLVCDIRNYS